ncbi:MAG: tripartite tricarboxylate transporter family receptor [Hyphomicrobiales bacterium]|nr:tripartite tricarboxylate transporter family receptor [Hyphomicrobiales bacterium]
MMRVAANFRIARALQVSSPALTVALSLALAGAARADEISDFYAGKQVTMLVGFGVGGGGDTYARLLARHLGEHIPGKPTIIVQNMPGGGGLVATNHLFNAAPQDGTVIMSMLAPTILEPLMGNKNARWDAAKFEWLGNLTRDFIGCVASGRSGIKSIREAQTREIMFGATGPSASSATHPYALTNILGYKTKVIAGYKGTSEVWLAMEKGEVEAVCAFWASQGAVQKKREMDTGLFVPIAQMGPEKHPIFKDAPLVDDLARDDEEKAVMKLIFGPNEVSRPFAAPPNVPAPRLKALQKAFWDAAHSPELRADAEKQGLYVEPMNAEATGAAFKAMVTMPKKIFDRAAAAIRAPGGN